MIERLQALMISALIIAVKLFLLMRIWWSLPCSYWQEWISLLVNFATFSPHINFEHAL